MAGTLSVQKIQGLASSATPTVVEVSSGHALHANTLKGTTTAGSINVQGEGSNTTNLQQGLAKAWCNFQGTSTISIHDSFNVTDLTDVGTGQYKVNYTTAMTSDKYGYSFCANAQTDVGMDDNATTYCFLFVRQGWDTTTIDISEPCCVIHGDLA